MNVRRSWFFFLVMLVLAACCILFLTAKPITEAVLTLRGTPEHITWQAVGAGSGKTAVAAGWRDGELLLRFFTTEGKPLSEQAYELPEEMEGATVSQLLPLGDGEAYAGLYGADAEELYLYRFSSGEAERLLALPCVGGSFLDRTSRTQLSELTSEDGVLSFAVRTDRKIEQYLCRGSGGLEPAGTAKCGKNTLHAPLPPCNWRIATRYDNGKTHTQTLLTMYTVYLQPYWNVEQNPRHTIKWEQKEEFQPKSLESHNPFRLHHFA